MRRGKLICSIVATDKYSSSPGNICLPFPSHQNDSWISQLSFPNRIGDYLDRIGVEVRQHGKEYNQTDQNSG